MSGLESSGQHTAGTAAWPRLISIQSGHTSHPPGPAGPGYTLTLQCVPRYELQSELYLSGNIQVSRDERFEIGIFEVELINH